MKEVKGIMSKSHLNMKNKWTVTIEMSFPIGRYDLQQIFDDDNEIDYMYRAWERFFPILEEMVKEDKISSYRLREVPHRLDMKVGE